MNNYRVIIIVLDSVGIGYLPDADKYGDSGCNTLGNIARAVSGLNLPQLARMGLGNIAPLAGIAPVENPSASFGKMAEKSAGKDTSSGHWELMGLINPWPFPTYPQGFPDEIIKPFQKQIGTKIIGNKPASGTEIIQQLGNHHLETGYPIVYTSADSVFQIAAHENIIPVSQLYHLCTIARRILTKPHNVARVIARPFIGKPDNFTRTSRRRDFSLPPAQPTLLDYLNSTLGIGKIKDIFAGRGITKSIHTKNNQDGIQQTISSIHSNTEYKLIFTNLVDFDMLYGHRNDVAGYYKCLREFDSHLPRILEVLREKDILLITADHGCDPTTPGTDHTREYVPLLVYGAAVKPGIDLGIRKTFADTAQTMAQLWDIPELTTGTSFLDKILNK